MIQIADRSPVTISLLDQPAKSSIDMAPETDTSAKPWSKPAGFIADVSALAVGVKGAFTRL